MLNLIWLIPTFPLASFLILALFGQKLPKKTVPMLGVGSVGLSALVSFLVVMNYAFLPPDAPTGYRLILWGWMNLGNFTPNFAFYLDPLSCVMLLVVTFVGFLIHVYSAQYMAHDNGYSRFFAYLNLFVSAMLILVLADNLVLILVGWEGVGLCSYLLIGFWYQKPANGRAARKAFVVTRIGDTAMALGLFLLFAQFGTIQIQEVITKALAAVSGGGILSGIFSLDAKTTVGLAAALLMGGAMGKSAQVPLHVWLPDAMAGPSPVSALIHAATMVTAGVYLVARMQMLYVLSPDIQFGVAVVGAATLFLAGCAALVARDFKRVLAYSTISQIGYMFFALGVGAWTAGIFHLVTHAFFKSLLFLAAGAVIESLHHENDIFKMGGLREKMPVIFWTFLAGSSCLAALPFVTSGFYSKDMILKHAWTQPGMEALLIVGLLGSLITAIYSFRLFFVVFYGEEKTHVHDNIGNLMKVPLVILATCALLAGCLGWSGIFGSGQSLLTFLSPSLPVLPTEHLSHSVELLQEIILIGVPLFGLFVAYWFYCRRPEVPKTALQNYSGLRMLHAFWFIGWGFDWLFDNVFVKPFVGIAFFNKVDFIDSGYTLIARFHMGVNQLLSLTQSGLVKSYAVGIVLGGLIFIAVMVFL